MMISDEAIRALRNMARVRLEDAAARSKTIIFRCDEAIAMLDEIARLRAELEAVRCERDEHRAELSAMAYRLDEVTKERDEARADAGRFENAWREGFVTHESVDCDLVRYVPPSEASRVEVETMRWIGVGFANGMHVLCDAVIRSELAELALDVVRLESERDLRPDIAPEDVALVRWAAARDSRRLSKVERAKVYAARRRIHEAMEAHAAKAGEPKP